VGTEQTGPSLPLNIDLESASPYVNADSIAVTSTTLDESAFREVTVHGIVRGQSRTVSLSDQQTVRETNLTHGHQRQRDARGRPRNGHGDGDRRGCHQRSCYGRQPDCGAEQQRDSHPHALESRGARTRGVPAIRVVADRSSLRNGNGCRKDAGELSDFQTLIQVVVVTILWFIPLAVLVFGFDYMSDGALLGLSNRT